MPHAELLEKYFSRLTGGNIWIAAFFMGEKVARFAFDLICWQVTLRSHPATGEALKSEMKYACRIWHGSGVALPAASHRRFCCVLSVLLQGHICSILRLRLLARVWGCWYKSWSTFKGIVHSKMKTLTLFTCSHPTSCYLVLWSATGGFFYYYIHTIYWTRTTILIVLFFIRYYIYILGVGID